MNVRKFQYDNPVVYVHNNDLNIEKKNRQS